MVTYKPDFKKAYVLANEILVKSHIINNFPFSITRVISEVSDIQCCSFKRARAHGVDIDAFGSEAAVLTEYIGRLIIFYNQDDIEERIRFSMLHEVGHYLLNHKLDTEDTELYKKQEIETNFFAAQLLMPEQALIEFQKRGKRISIEFLTRTFKVSKEAARKRVETLNKIKPEYRSMEEQEYDDIILLKYKAFIDTISPEKNMLDWFENEYARQQERDNWI